MKIELLNMISDASINSYYDKSLDLVVVWFHNDKSNKQDVVSYLLKDMTWDVRRVISEVSVLINTGEVVTINHESIGLFEKDSQFDTTIRSVLKQLTEQKDETGGIISELESIRVILDDNTYGEIE